MHFYENFNSFSSEVNLGRDELNFIADEEIAQYEKMRKSNENLSLRETHNAFCEDNKLICFCRVYIFTIETTRSERRRDFYCTKTKYALYYKGI